MRSQIFNESQCVVLHQCGWEAKETGNAHAHSVHGTQHKAIAAAHETASGQGSKMLIHGENGHIRERKTYFKDSYPPKG